MAEIDLPKEDDENYLGIKVLTKAENNKTEISLWCEKQKFTSTEHPDNIYHTLAQYIINLTN